MKEEQELQVTRVDIFRQLVMEVSEEVPPMVDCLRSQVTCPDTLAAGLGWWVRWCFLFFFFFNQPGLSMSVPHTKQTGRKESGLTL